RGPASSGGAPGSSAVLCPDAFGPVSALAIATLGSLGAKAQSLETGFSNAGASGSASYSDTVTFSGPGTDPIAVSVNLHFSGSLSTTDLATAAVNAQAFLAGTGFGLIFGVHNGVFDFCENSFTGVPCGVSPDGTLITGSVLVPVNVPVEILLSLSASASANGLDASSTAEFSNTFGFVT